MILLLGYLSLAPAEKLGTSPLARVRAEGVHLSLWSPCAPQLAHVESRPLTQSLVIVVNL